MPSHFWQAMRPWWRSTAPPEERGGCWKPPDPAQPITRIRPPESSVHTIAWTSVFDAWLGSKKARSSASDLISASGAEPVWSSAPYTYRDSAAVGLSLSQESGGARRKSPRSRNRWVPSCRPNQERYGVALSGRPVSTGFGGGAEPPKDRGWERERVSNQ